MNRSRPILVAWVVVMLGVLVAPPASAQTAEGGDSTAALVAIDEYGALLAPLLEPDQVRAWDRLRNDDERARFVRDFWAQLDPTPGTEANERREIYEARARRAIEEFSEDGIAGYATDRGRVLMVYGLPDEQELRAVPSGTAPTMTWRYTRHTPTFEVVFVGNENRQLVLDEGPELNNAAFLRALGDDLRLHMVSSVGNRDRSLAPVEPVPEATPDVFAAEPTPAPPPDLAPEVKIWMERVFGGVQRDDIGLRQRLHYFPASQGTYVALSFTVDRRHLLFELPEVDAIGLEVETGIEAESAAEGVSEAEAGVGTTADPETATDEAASAQATALAEPEEEIVPRADLRVFGAFLQGEPGQENTLHSFIVPHPLLQAEGDLAVSAPLSLGVSLFPGEYRLVWGVLDAGSGRATTRDLAIVVPDLATGPLALTEPVLAATEVRDDLRPMSTEMVYEGLRLGNVLIANSIDGEFDRDDTVEIVVIVTGWASDPGAPGKPRLEVVYRILSGLEGDESIARLPEQLLDFHVLGQQIPLAQVNRLRGGRSYRIEVRVRDLVSGAETVTQAPIHLRPEPAEDISG